MTKLERIVRRSLAAGSRDLVVTLHPGHGDHPPLIEVREKGRRSGYTAPIASLFIMLAQREADRKLAARRGARRTSLRTLVAGRDR